MVVVVPFFKRPIALLCFDFNVQLLHTTTQMLIEFSAAVWQALYAVVGERECAVW